MRLSASLTVGLLALSVLAGCGSADNVSVKGPPLVATAGALAMDALAESRAKRSGAVEKPKKQPSRAALEKAGKPVLSVSIPSRGTDVLVSDVTGRAGVLTWRTKDETTFSMRNGILIQTRGLGPDLMSSNVPTVEQLLKDGGKHQREYFFLGPNDQPTRRTYECSVRVVGTKEISILQRNYTVTQVKEDCSRPQTGKITNDFWFDGQTVRKSRQWTSASIGMIEFQRIVD